MLLQNIILVKYHNYTRVERKFKKWSEKADKMHCFCIWHGNIADGRIPIVYLCSKLIVDGKLFTD